VKTEAGALKGGASERELGTGKKNSLKKGAKGTAGTTTKSGDTEKAQWGGQNRKKLGNGRLSGRKKESQIERNQVKKTKKV